MEPINSQVESQEVKEVVVYPSEGEAGVSGAKTDTPSIAWTASNQSTAQAISSANPVGNHARSQSIVESLGSPTSTSIEAPQHENGRSEYHPPLLRQNSSSLPSFKYLISSVDDPNDKNPIPPIAYNTDNPHASNSSPIRKQHICYSCKKSFPSKNSLSKHKQIHGERSHICGDCGAKFHTKKDLTRHRDTVHGENSASYVCPVPDCARSNPKRAFSRRDNLRQHILQLHDKKFLIEIKNPQGSSQAEKNPPGSPEGGSSPLSDDTPMHPRSIDEAIEDIHPERNEIRTSVEIATGHEDLDEDEDLMVIEERGRDRATDNNTQSQQLEIPPERPSSSHDRGEPIDVLMSTPRITVEDPGTVPELQEPLPEPKIQLTNLPLPSDIANESKPSPPQNNDDDEAWALQFLEKLHNDEHEVVAKLNTEGLKSRYPDISSQRRLDFIKFTLLGFETGFQRGYQLAQTRVSGALSVAPLAAASRRTSLSVTSPAYPSDAKGALSPLTPISAASPTNHDTSMRLGLFAQPQQVKETARIEASFIRPSLPRSNTESLPARVDDHSRPGPVATEEGVAEYKCNNSKCSKVFSKKSEWKKHMQRHRRPFFCTFHWQERSEVQRFGSKDDWRRHEEHRHYQSEFYKCPGGSHKSCRSAWIGKPEFEEHLEEHHKEIVTSWSLDGKVDDEAKRDFFQKHHNGTDYVEDNFWCGFCARLIAIPPEMTGRRGKEVRVNHVADHFHKEQKDIRLWVKYNECNLAETDKALKNARTKYERETNLLQSENETSDQQRQLPPIKEIFGPGEPFSAASLGSSPVAPDFWICCECQVLAQTRPNFVYVMNIGKDSECSSNEHPPHNRCPRCSKARS
ncbi:hypothetical protein TWF730_008990 [Orbilia blumenaviensis]|uniref:C2H2-type domain-containing protein n=1 Tax=Orbilia blumenaviensis TaxID=1796055 RepID=A0AAV9UX83_9PEZI